MMEFLMEEWHHIHPIEFQALVESILRHIDAVLAARALLRHFMLVFPFTLSVTCTTHTGLYVK
jgi:hypothetical protein